MAVIPYTQQLYKGLSSDQKPAGNIGDEFTEEDTGKTFKKEANGWAEDITGDNLKSGTVVITEDSSAVVTFTIAFAVTPNVVVTPDSNDSDHQATADSITVNGFTAYMNKSGGGAADEITVHWIATDAGNG